ncbi:MAG: DUF86 domain-containing protein [Ardenticatenaceae bacterium]|nr:DUF86 domain-containing protein [Ardenticatenaceae bacterium]
MLSPQPYSTRSKDCGGCRNVLVHIYQEIDPASVADSFHKGLHAFPQFAQEILLRLDTLES